VGRVPRGEGIEKAGGNGDGLLLAGEDIFGCVELGLFIRACRVSAISPVWYEVNRLERRMTDQMVAELQWSECADEDEEDEVWRHVARTLPHSCSHCVVVAGGRASTMVCSMFQSSLQRAVYLFRKDCVQILEMMFA
jgi:hypothetical protein